jgi:predicted nucleic acid-binding protein
MEVRPGRSQRAVSVYFDTNVLVYAFSVGQKGEIAWQLLARGGATGVQNLTEFANVARKKLKMDWSEVRSSIDRIATLATISEPIDLELHGQGLLISQRYQLGVFDSMIVAAALRFGCTTLWTEDLHDGLVVENVLTIRNPFA